jgi:hypothetical protein
MPGIGSCVFTMTGYVPTNNFDKYRQRSTGLLGLAVGLHDSRPTARSLMSGVDSDIAERCLAHTIGGVRGVRDRYAYHAENKHAFEALAAQIERNVNPAVDVVGPILRNA